MTQQSSLSFVADLADAIRAQAVQAGAETPAVRGGDWRQATVTAVNTDGTVVVDSVITARRLPIYHLPKVGDVIVVLRSGAGGWLAAGRMATAAGTWTPLPLNSGFGTAGGGAAPAYLVEGKRITLRGRAGPTSGTIANGTVIASIPAAIRPGGGGHFGWAGVRDSPGTNTVPNTIRMEITSSGDLRTYDVAFPPAWVSLDGVSYFID